MGQNPSTVWTTLSQPNAPMGSVPFVDTDNVSIINDVLNLYYTAANNTTLLAGTGGTIAAYQLTAAGGFRNRFADISGAPGNGAVNFPSGRAAFAAGASVAVITCSYCFATSIIRVQLEINDATLNRVIVTPGAGSFTVTGNASATGITKFNFDIKNVY